MRLKIGGTQFFLSFVIATMIGTPVQAQRFDGNLLPNQNDGTGGANVLPKTINQIQSTAADTDVVNRYVGNAGANGGPFRGQPSGGGVQPPIVCDSCEIGTMYFEFGAYTGNFPGRPANSAGGMLIRGGFRFNPGVSLAPDHSLRWLQYFTETGGAGRQMIDGQPLYPNHTLAGFDALFFDAPVDDFGSAVIPTSIDFEAALVCFDNNDPMDLFAIGSFLWGYDIDVANMTINNEFALIFTPGLTQTFHNVFDAEFGATGTRGQGWTLTDGCNDCFVKAAVPEPASIGYFVLGIAIWILMLGRTRRRAV